MSSRISQLAFAIATLPFFVACGSDFDPASRITSLRVVAVQADKPYAKPGEEVALQAVFHDPKTRPLNWAWAVCVNPQSSSVLGCMLKFSEDARTNPSSMLFSLGVEQSNFKITIPQNAISSLPEAGRQNALLGVVSITCPGEIKLGTTQPQGKFEVPIQCIESGTNRVLPLEEYVIGIKRIFVRNQDRNLNPAIKRVTWDGQDWPESEIKSVSACDTEENRFDRCDGAEQHRIALELNDEAFEKGKDEFGADFTEQLIVQYYATEGLFEQDVRIAKEPETKWVARKKASGQVVKIWLVSRDNRGGVAIATRQVQVK